MDFPTFFVTLRTQIEKNLDPAFQTARNVPVCDRLTALHAWFDSNVDTKLLGVISMGGPPVHSHEHRLVFSIPHFDRSALEDWWQYAQTVQNTLVHPDAAHQFSLISLILVCEKADPSALRRLRWLSREKTYSKPENGWSSLRFAVVCAQNGKISNNRAGGALASFLRPLLP